MPGAKLGIPVAGTVGWATGSLVKARDRRPARYAGIHSLKWLPSSALREHPYLVTLKTGFPAWLTSSQVVDSMEREMGLEPTTSSLGKWISIVNKGFRRQRRCFLVDKVFRFQGAVSPSLVNEVNEVATELVS